MFLFCGGTKIREKVEIFTPLGRNQALGAHMRATGCARACMFGSPGCQKLTNRAPEECASGEHDEIFDGVEAQSVFFCVLGLKFGRKWKLSPRWDETKPWARICAPLGAHVHACLAARAARSCFTGRLWSVEAEEMM